MTYTDRELREIAYNRATAHSHPDLTPEPEQVRRDYIGVLGEAAFAHEFDCLIDTTCHGSDPGYDFQLIRKDRTWKVDTKCTAHPAWLPVKIFPPPAADIYVMCRYHSLDSKPGSRGALPAYVAMLGYATRDEMMDCKQGKLTADGPTNYLMPVADLHPMWDLKRLIGDVG